MTISSPAWPAHYDWMHPDPMTRAFELVEGGTVRGSLRFTNLVGSRASGSAYGAAWDLRRTGIFRPRIEGRAAGAADDEPIEFTIALEFSGTGTMERAGTDALQWGLAGEGDDQAWGWLLDGTPLVTFVPAPSDDGLVAAMIQLQGRARLHAAAGGRNDVPLLLVTGWYLMAARQFDLVVNPVGV
ncbi:MAG: hypothetical protein U5K74_09405 [Gemmatimonadaceae bacterium]|nr:hypothetical protein [Gemmatimonadaceae bacterium]